MEDLHPPPEEGSHLVPEEAVGHHPPAARGEGVDGSGDCFSPPVGVPHGDELVGVHADPLPPGDDGG